MASVSYILSFIKNAKSRFGEYAKISYRLSGINNDDISISDAFLWEIESMKRIDNIYIRIGLPYTTRTFNITPQLLKIQRALRKRYHN